MSPGRHVTDLALALYPQLVQGDQNLLFSPYSVVAAMAMAREGARGETAAQMDKVLHLPNDLTATQRALREGLQPLTITEWDMETGQSRSVPAFELSVANSLWGQRGYAFEQPFLDVLERDYGAPLQKVDFRQSELARGEINVWVSEHTRARIPELIPPGLPDPITRLAIVNALYFKAKWAETFDDNITAPAPFHCLGGETLEAMLMHREGRYPYVETSQLQVAELPYQGDATSLVVLLPRTPEDFQALEEALRPSMLQTTLASLKPTKLDLKLPRFSICAPCCMGAILKGLGMPLAFQQLQADFSGMSTSPDEPLSIGEVIHEAFIDVYEQGTEAAAATVVVMFGGCAPAPSAPPVPFVCDRPFLFLLRHKPTDTILFLGRVTQPQSAK